MPDPGHHVLMGDVSSPTRRTAVVSGGGTGIGMAIAAGLLADGCDVMLLGRREAVLREAAATLGELGSVFTHAVDLSDPTAVEVAVPEVVAALGGSIDVVVANAGRGAARPGESLESHRDAWLDAIAGNTMTAVLLVGFYCSLLNSRFYRQQQPIVVLHTSKEPCRRRVAVQLTGILHRTAIHRLPD